MFDNDSPLNRISSESKRANQALRDYALMGVGRSIRGLFDRYSKQTLSGPLSEKPPTTKQSTLFNWSVTYEWVKRASRFDEIEEEKRLQEREQRRRQLEESDWETGAKLRKRVEEFLDLLPKFTTKAETVSVEEITDPVTGEKMKQVTRVVTTKLNTNVQQLAGAIKAASELQRLATDQPTENINLSGSALDSAIQRELERLSKHNVTD